MQGIAATLALLATSAAAQSVGSAIVNNACPYDVYLTSVPAPNANGYEVTSEVLSPGDTWSQEWKELNTGAGWAHKLSKDQSLSHILQYEYTFHDDGVIWFDLSQVNGNPWQSDWVISATSASGQCDPHQRAYRYPTDDTWGMQSSCPQDSDVTLTLCAAGGDESAVAPASTTQVVTNTAVPTTMATVASTTTADADVTVTNVNTAVVTETETVRSTRGGRGGRDIRRRHGHNHA